MTKFKLVYFGSPAFSASFLERILAEKSDLLEVVAVVTQPDRPVGRKQVLTPSAVATTASKYKIPVFHSISLDNHSRATWDTGMTGGPTGAARRDYQAHQNISYALQFVDFALVFAYGEIIPDALLSLPKYGFINIHPSLLPLYRGASPTAYPLILGDSKTGISIMQMDQKMDHGNILTQSSVPLTPHLTRNELETSVVGKALDLFINAVHNLPSKGSPQDHSKATYTRQLVKQDGFIVLSLLKKALSNEVFDQNEIPTVVSDYQSKYGKKDTRASGQILYDLYRGLTPWPGLWTKVNINNKEMRLKLTLLAFDNNTLQIKRVQLEGKNEVDFSTFQTAYNLL